jgi:hypothetical protein
VVVPETVAESQIGYTGFTLPHCFLHKSFSQRGKGKLPLIEDVADPQADGTFPFKKILSDCNIGCLKGGNCSLERPPRPEVAVI